MKKVISIAAMLLAIAAIAGFIIYKSNSSKTSSTQEPSVDEIQVTEEDDGSYTFTIPLTVTNPKTGEAITQWTSVNSKEMPAKILLEIDGQENIVFSVNLEGTDLQVAFYPESEKKDKNVIYKNAQTM